MSKIVLKKSSVAGKIPQAVDLEYGELAINYSDGKLFFKNSSNSVVSFSSDASLVTIDGAQTLTNKTLTAPTITGGAINNTVIGGTTAASGSFTSLNASGTSTFTGPVTINNSGGGGGSSEGGEIQFALATANSTLSGAVVVDVYQNKLRIFERDGSNRGVFIDLSTALSSVGSNLLVTSTPTLYIAGDTGSDTINLGADTLTFVGGSTIGATVTNNTVTIALKSAYGDTANPYASKTANTFLAAPNGSAGAPTFRAITAADIPTLNQNTTGTASNITAYTINQNLGTSDTPSFDKIISNNNGNGTNFKVGDDAWIGDINTANTIRVTGAQDPTGGYIVFGNSNTTALGRTGTGPLTYGGSALVTVGDTGTVTNTMLAGSIANSKLANSTISGVALGSNLNVLTLNVSGTGLSGSTTYNGSAAATFTVTSNATSSNTASTIVARDASGNFTAGTITAALNGNASTVTNGVYTTGSYADPAWITSINYSKLTGTIPTWNQNTTGSAAKWTTARTLSFTGDATGTGSVDGSADVSTTLTLASVGTAGTYTKVTTDSKGRVTSGTTLSASDIPTLNQNTTGTASNVTGVVAIANGGTNATAFTAPASNVRGLVSFDGTRLWNDTTPSHCGYDETVHTFWANKQIVKSTIDQQNGIGVTISQQAAIQASVATTTQTAIDTFAATTYRSVKYVVQVSQGSNYQVSEILVIHDGTTAFMTEYGVLSTGNGLATFAVDINSGNVRLLVSMASATSATINITRTTIVV